VYSPDRWGLTGDAGVFLDPFYSPGSDFIAIANGCNADLILRDLAGEPIAERAEAFNEMYLEEFHRVLRNYTWQYELWGNPKVMSVKLGWDLLLYWGVTALRAIQGVWHDPDFAASERDTIGRAHRLNERMQAFFREWHAIDNEQVEGEFVPLVNVIALGKRKFQLDGEHEPDAVRALLAENVETMEAMAVLVFHEARRALTGADLDDGRAVNPYAIGLDPDRWEQDGLFGEPGLTSDEAHSRAPGVEGLWFEEVAMPAGGPPGAGPPSAGPPGS
jgi:hypothetical protein